MRRTILWRLVVGLFVSAGALATAQNISAGTQPKAKVDSTTQESTKQTQFSIAAIDRSKKADYKAARFGRVFCSIKGSFANPSTGDIRQAFKDFLD